MSNKEITFKMLSNLSVGELKEKRLIFKKELFSLRIQKTLGENKNTSLFAKIRKNIARVNTRLKKIGG